MNSTLRTAIENAGQKHILEHYDGLASEAQSALEAQLERIDWSELSELVAKALDKSASESSGQGQLEALPDAIRLPESEEDREGWKSAAAAAAGEELLQAGKVGAILVAGGQGTRLGFPHPKGVFPIGPVSDRTLFQIFFEQLIALSNRYNVRIPYFIMTSDATHDETEAFLKEHSNFGFPEEDLFLFKQGTMPAVDDQTGALLLKDATNIAMSPDGHGGLLKALSEANLFEEMKSRGVETLFYHQVDNPCVRICDPAMLGFHQQKEAEISTKVVSKRNPEERVGVLGMIDGLQGIIEYSDLSQELSEATDEHGRLKFWAGNIAVHVMERSLLERLSQGDQRLPVHIAHKKVPYLDQNGEAQAPEQPNAYKFERFIFDAIPRAKNPVVIETSRREEFNPVKNAEGDDSPASSRAALLEQSREWLKTAGYEVSENQRIEISPLMALSPQDLAGAIEKDSLSGDEIIIAPTEEETV